MRVGQWWRWLLAMAVVALGLLPALPALAGGYPAGTVLVLHVDNLETIDNGMAQHIHRVMAAAGADPNVKAVVVRIDTPGGYVQSAIAIRDDLLHAKVPTIAYVDDHAFSAGALIALASEKVYMFPTAVMGAAEPIPTTNKTVSAVKAEFKIVAETRGRDPVLAQAMVDKDQGAPGQQPGQVMTFTATEAIKARLADGQANGIDDALRQAGITGYTLQDIRPTLPEYAARVLTTPWVAVGLLLVGISGIAIEFVKPGVTVPGLVGALGLGLFFIGNFLTGTAGLVELGLLILGGVLFVIEVLVPGHAIFGVSGVISIMASIFLSIDNPSLAVWYLAIAGVGFSVLLVLLFRAVGRRGLGKALTLESRTSTEEGYVPGRNQLAYLVGHVGTALTVLRPSGSAVVDGHRMDVVTQGEYLSAGTPVEVLEVNGARVIVRAVEDQE